jgi:tRNA dimethylallyltransferase
MKKVLILLGPTGVGKTGASLLLAKTLNTEIISADSMQIYRHMDIGTAKPSPEEREHIVHHMIDIADPWETYSAGKYISAVKPILEHLLMQGRTPVIVGGTGLYIRAMTRGIFSGPSADWILREELLAIEQDAKGSLYGYLKALDPAAVEKITPNDTRRLIRALEVCCSSGGTMSEMQKKFTQPLPYEFIKIGLTRDRKELYRIIEERVDAMVKEGLIEEVKIVMDLIEEHSRMQNEKNHGSEIRDLGYSPLPAMQAIGYKEIVSHLRGEIALTEALALIKKASKRYAKRQFTWFRKEEYIRWVDITGIKDPQKVLRKIYPILPILSETLPAEGKTSALQY